ALDAGQRPKLFISRRHAIKTFPWRGSLPDPERLLGSVRPSLGCKTAATFVTRGQICPLPSTGGSGPMLFSWLLRRRASRPVIAKPRRSTRLTTFRPSVEVLESRVMPSYTVMNLNDDTNSGSLRYALTSQPDHSIVFESGLSGTISLVT